MCVLLSLETRLHCSKNQLQSSNKIQKILKCKSTIYIATFNVKSLKRIGQIPELTASAIDHNIDIICIQEHRYIHNEDIIYHVIGNGWTFVSASA